MKKLLVIVCIEAVVVFSTARATDVPHGSETLPYAAMRADAVAEAVSATRLESSNPGFSVYQINVGTFVRGSGSKTVVAIIPKGIDVREPQDFAKSIVFLRGPLTESALRIYNTGIPGPVFEVVAGRYGVVTLKAPSIAREVRDYVTIPDSARLQWANRNVESSSVYLQRSAVSEARRHLGDVRAFAVLNKALGSTNVESIVKREAIICLQQTESEQALGALKNAALNLQNTPEVRRTAVEAIGGLTSGWEVLKELKISDDPAVSVAAERALVPTNTKSPVDVAGLFASGTLQQKLQSLQSLGQANTKEAATALKSVVLDGTQQDLVRKNAILSLSQFESGIGTSALRDIVMHLPDSELKALAATLSNE